MGAQNASRKILCWSTGKCSSVIGAFQSKHCHGIIRCGGGLPRNSMRMASSTILAAWLTSGLISSQTAASAQCCVSIQPVDGWYNWRILRVEGMKIRWRSRVVHGMDASFLISWRRCMFHGVFSSKALPLFKKPTRALLASVVLVSWVATLSC